MRIFVAIRQTAIQHKDLAEKIMKIEKKYNKNFKDIFKAIDYLVNGKEVEQNFKNRKKLVLNLIKIFIQ